MTEERVGSGKAGSRGGSLLSRPAQPFSRTDNCEECQLTLPGSYPLTCYSHGCGEGVGPRGDTPVALALTSCWLSVPAMTLQLLFSVLKKELMFVEPSLLTHVASLTVLSRLGWSQSI